MNEAKKQSVVGMILDYLFPQPYGFCLAAYTRAHCQYFRASDGKCHALDDALGEHPEPCTGRRV